MISNRLYLPYALVMLGAILLSVPRPVSATFVRSCSLPQLCAPKFSDVKPGLLHYEPRPQILASAECFSPEKESSSPPLNHRKVFIDVSDKFRSMAKAIENISETLAKSLSLDEIDSFPEIGPAEAERNQVVFDYYLKELSKPSREAVFKQLGYLSPAQIKKINSQIKEGIDSIPAQPDPNGNYQKTRRDIVSEVVFKRIGKNMVELTTQQTADETGKMIAYRALNPESYQYIAAGFPTKPMAIKGKSAQGNLIGGLIPIDAKFSKSAGKPEENYFTKLNKELLAKNPDFGMVHLTRQMGGVTQVAVFKEVTTAGKKRIIEQWKSEADLVKSPGEWTKHELIGMKTKDRSGRIQIKPITADVDLAFVGKDKTTAEGTEPVYYHETKGHVSRTENRILKVYNKNARKLGAPQDLVNHGSQANDPSDAELEGKVAIAIPQGKGLLKVMSQSEATKFATEGVGRKFSIEGSNLKGMGAMMVPVKRSLTPLPSFGSDEALSSHGSQEDLPAHIQ
ncbi:MAG: anthrax toxin-like adenylyl cyclase domain-containing protein [Bdellovibrionia bacterium]